MLGKIITCDNCFELANCMNELKRCHNNYFELINVNNELKLHKIYLD